MDLVKKNLLSIICGVVALICVVLLFVPFGGMYSELQDSVKKSKATGDSIKRVANEAREWPSLSPVAQDKKALTQFPTEAIIRLGKDLTSGWTTEAQRFLSDVVQKQRGQLAPLVPGALPGNTSDTIKIRFVEEYQKRFGIYLNPQTRMPDARQSLFNTVLRAGQPPSADEITARQAEVAAETRASEEVVLNGQVTNEPQVQQRIAEETAKVPERLRAKVARSSAVYADPLQLLKPVPLPVGKAPSSDLIFYAQVHLWMTEQVCSSIAEINAGAAQAKGSDYQGVLDSPIKRVVKLDAIEIPYRFVAPQPGSSTEQLTVPAGATTLITPSYARGPWGHAPNQFYDPILIKGLTFICEAKQLPHVLGELTAGRFLVIRDVQVETVDAGVEAASGYLYGNSPVVQVTVNMHYLMLRPFIKDFTPPAVIRGLNLQTGESTGDNGMGGGSEMGAPGMGGPATYNPVGEDYTPPGFGGGR